jgi:hypothetical protein
MNNLDNLSLTQTIRVLSIIILLIGSLFFILPVWNVWRQERSGEADFSEAEWSKRIKVEDAKALRDSAVFAAQAEVERAKGVAEANRIIGTSLKENEEYLRYLWIQGLHDGSSETIYIPTEANMPLLEATRRND